MAKKGNRVQVILECTEQKASGVPGMSRYITTKNKKNTPDRLERKKYNPLQKQKIQSVPLIFLIFLKKRCRSMRRSIMDFRKISGYSRLWREHCRNGSRNMKH